MKPKKYTTIQRIKRLENIVAQMYLSLETIKTHLDKKEKK
tara:strand:+ start:22 stop:141 length:120 start_codon:yes stop_codon:yes gene_type:complete